MLSEVITDSSLEKDTVTRVFYLFYNDLYEKYTYQPHSGKFFQKVFNLFYNLAQVTLSEKDQELVDCVILLMYCGHIVTVLFRALIDNSDV